MQDDSCPVQGQNSVLALDWSGFRQVSTQKKKHLEKCIPKYIFMTHKRIVYIKAKLNTLHCRVNIFYLLRKGKSIMATKSINEARLMQEDWQAQQGDEYISCSVGIMAHNEEANIGRTMRAVLEQQGLSLRIVEVIVVASGCTDRTVPIVAEIVLQEPRVRLCIQEKREGKASAINLFLKQATSPIVVLIGADV